ncbi:hypothetical protein [Alienimonas sp. DA493]|uniref:hypothetical protein n=1 Tax=Alienimonas sp. DA493 TaxID=3373605 RepID=UPI003754A9DC
MPAHDELDLDDPGDRFRYQQRMVAESDQLMALFADAMEESAMLLARAMQGGGASGAKAAFDTMSERQVQAVVAGMTTLLSEARRNGAADEVVMQAAAETGTKLPERPLMDAIFAGLKADMAVTFERWSPGEGMCMVVTRPNPVRPDLPKLEGPMEDGGFGVSLFGIGTTLEAPDPSERLAEEVRDAVERFGPPKVFNDEEE